MSRQRRPLSVQALENRRLMAGDAFAETAADDAILDGTQGVTIPAGQPTVNRSMDMASPDLVQHLSDLDADATDALVGGDQPAETNRFFDVFFNTVANAEGGPDASSLTDDGGFIEPFDAFSIPEAPIGLTVTINGVNDPPAPSSVDAESTDAVMAGSGSDQVKPWRTMDLDDFDSRRN